MLSVLSNLKGFNLKKHPSAPNSFKIFATTNEVDVRTLKQDP